MQHPIHRGMRWRLQGRVLGRCMGGSKQGQLATYYPVFVYFDYPLLYEVENHYLAVKWGSGVVNISTSVGDGVGTRVALWLSQ